MLLPSLYCPIEQKFGLKVVSIALQHMCVKYSEGYNVVSSAQSK